jgi:hypothetical protein
MAEQKKRRNSIEICQGLRNERNRYYNQRKTVINQLRKPKLSNSKKNVLDKRYNSLTSRIDKVKVKIFKCGKKYAKLKKERASLLRKISYVKAKYSLLKGKGNKKEKNLLLTEMITLNREVEKISTLMRMPIIEKGKADLSVVTDNELAEITEQVVIWRVKEKVETLLSVNRGRLESIEINGEIYSTDNVSSALEELEDYIAEIAAKQREGRFSTPVITITINLLEKTIIIE